MTSPPRRRADLALVFNAFIWGSTFVVVKEALQDCSTLLFLAIRFTLAATALAILFRKALRGTGAKQLVKAGCGAGSLLFSGYVLQTIGLRHTTPSKSAFITGLSIVLVPLMAGVVDRRWPRWAEICGVAIATVGLILLTMPAASLRIDLGDMLTVGCAVVFAAHVLAVGHYARRVGFQALTLSQVVVAAVLASATFWWAEPIHIRFTPGLAFAVAVTGLLATALAFSVQAWAQQYTSPTHTALIFSLEPVFGWATSFVVEGEVLPLRGTIGALLILAGILLVEMRSSTAPAAPPATS